MVERTNGIIKKEIILKENYANKEEMNDAPRIFLVYLYAVWKVLYGRHSEVEVRKKLNVKTPFQAVEKYFMSKHEIFKQNPPEFNNKIIFLKPIENPSFINDLAKLWFYMIISLKGYHRYNQYPFERYRRYHYPAIITKQECSVFIK